MQRLFIILIALLALLAAPALAQSTPTPGGTAIVVLGSDPEHLNAAISTSYPVGSIGASIYSALVFQASDGSVHGELAERWSVSDDQLTYTFTLREANFHDGTPLTAEDVVFTMRDVLGPNHGRFQRAFAEMESLEAPDARTVVITLKRPYAPLLGLLTVFDAPVLSKNLYQGSDPLTNPSNDTPIGSGPFRFVEWVRGERIVLERFDGYFLDHALLNRLIYRVVPQDVARGVALEVGEADLVWGFYMPTSDLSRLAANPNINVWKGLTIPSLYFMFVNNDHPQLGDARVRQAIMHAIDREQIVEQAQGGLGEVAGGPFGHGFRYAFDAALDYRTLYPHDPDRARALLAEAGVANLTLRFVFDSGRGAFAAAAEIMRDNLRQVGITLDVQPVERSVMVERVYGRDYDLTMQSFTSSGDPAIGYHRIYLSANPGTNFVNATGYSNADIDALLIEAAGLANQEARAALYRQALAILARDLPTLPMFDELSTQASTANLQGLLQRLDQRDGLEFAFFGN